MKQFVKLTICLLLILLAAQLSTAQKPELVVQTGHTDAIDCVVFSSDGSLLASGGRDNKVKIWHVATGKLLRTLEGPTKEILSVAFSPDDRLLAAAGRDHFIRLWEVATGKSLRLLDFTKDDWGARAIFSPDGKNLVGGSREGWIRRWDVSTGSELNPFDAEGSVWSIAYSPDGRLLAAGVHSWVGGYSIQLWDPASGTKLTDLEGHTSRIEAIAFSPDSRLLVSGAGGDDHTIRLWDVATGKQTHRMPFESGIGIDSVAFSPSGKLVASAHADGTIKFWDPINGQEQRSQISHPAHSAVDSIAFSPNGELLATAGFDDTIRLWDPSSGTLVRSFKGHSLVYSVAVSPNGQMLASGNSDHTIKVWDLLSGAQVYSLAGHSDEVYAVTFSPDNKMLASASRNNTIKLWNVSSGRQLPMAKGWIGSHTLAFSPNGKLLASVELGGASVCLWDVASGKLRALHNVAAHYLKSVAFSPDGSVLASGGTSGTLDLWEVVSGKLLRSLETNDPYAAATYLNVYSVAFSPDGRTLASGSDHDRITLWDVASGKELRALEEKHGEEIEFDSIAFSPDGKTLASGSTDSKIRLWDVANGTRVRSLEGHTNSVKTLAFSPDKALLVSGGSDGTTRLWDLGTGQELASLISQDNMDWVVATPDGLFDGSSSAWSKIIWRFNSNTFNYAPVEAFFSDFYYPGLLADIFAGKRPKAPSDISQKDRRQPQLKVSLASGQPDATLTTRNVAVKIDVAELAANKDNKTGSGAQDVRLFRNGSLARVWHGDVLKGQNSVTLEATIPIVAGENRLIAYAFNHDNIKSSDATLTVTGADSMKRKGTLHILAVGVSQYANREYNLNYTTDDATSFAAQVKLQQEKLARYESVNITTLLNENATKANILAELKKLTGSVQPEDGVVVYFSGHGKADGDHFYLVPHDLGYTGSRDQLSASDLQTVLKHSISDVELEEAFRDIDAGQMFMIIDACNSGQALENKDEPRRGPMNTRGLAQLAYEKGMYILTASQNVEEAFVSEKLKHSYLTYALVEEGLKTKAADADHNGEVNLREWFDYALARVPKLREETLQSKSLDEVNPTTRAAVRNQKSQTPRVFYRREADGRPMIVANVGASK